MENPIQSLQKLGQSIWYDNIERKLLEDGTLAEMIARGDIRGITSNPAIFQNAIAKSQDYDSALKTMAWAGYATGQIYEQLVLEDIRAAADLFLPLYRETNGEDGYVSLEVSPTLAHDAEGTIEEAQRLWELVSRPNLMIKIPATLEGLPAIRQSIACGINVNVTLIFSIQRYLQVIEAYLSGLEDRVHANKEIQSIASVASFFVSRIDTKVDKLLEAIMRSEDNSAQEAAVLRGKSAIASARLAYQQFLKAFQSERFQALKLRGARVQRPLWASTSTKNPAYPDTLYVDELIGPHTINTMPPQTLKAFRDHGRVRKSLEEGLDEAENIFTQLHQLGISMDQVAQELEQEGVSAFAEAYSSLLKTIEERRTIALSELADLAEPVAKRVRKLEAQEFLTRLHDHDPSLWSSEPSEQEEIRNRLGWLGLPKSSRELLPDLEALRKEVLDAGYTRVLLLGMGGSSLAPEVLRKVFGKPLPSHGLDLRILDSTDPTQVQAARRWAPVRHTLYIVSSKSGGTAEVSAFLNYFWARTERAVGHRAGEQFIAITDPGTSLEKTAQQRGFRRIFLADPAVGGRFSALSAFGLVPAALLGLDLEQLLKRASWMASQCTATTPAGRSPGLVLGAVIGESALLGKDKLTFLADPGLDSFGSWLEQLIAESSGKRGRGIIPVAGEPLLRPEDYDKDRVFIYLRRSGKYDAHVNRLRKAGFPVLNFTIHDNADLAAEFYRWEIAIAVACAILGVNAFDQPDVQDSKTRTVNRIQAFLQSGRLDEEPPIREKDGIRLYSASLPALSTATSLKDALLHFLKQARQGDYVAINAYLPRNPRSTSQLRQIRQAIRKKITPHVRLATTIGFGPRFLHSTGQLHKGGPNTGIFLQITVEPALDIKIPELGITFGTLERAQALGDLEGLQARGRRVLRIHLPNLAKLNALVQALQS